MSFTSECCKISYNSIPSSHEIVRPAQHKRFYNGAWSHNPNRASNKHLRNFHHAFDALTSTASTISTSIPSSSPRLHPRNQVLHSPRQSDPEPLQQIGQRSPCDKRHDDQHEQLHRITARIVIQFPEQALDLAHERGDVPIAGAGAPARGAIAGGGVGSAGAGGAGRFSNFIVLVCWGRFLVIGRRALS